MSKSLSTEMSVDQLRRHIADRNRQVPTDRMEIEEAEIMLQAKLLEQSTHRLDQLTSGLDQLRAELAQMHQGLHEGAEAQRGLQRAIRRYARSHSLATFLLLAATAVLLRVGWTQMEQSDLAFLRKAERPAFARPIIERPIVEPAQAARLATPGSPYHMTSFAATAAPAPVPALKSDATSDARSVAKPASVQTTERASVETLTKPIVVESAAKPEEVLSRPAIPAPERFTAVMGPAVLGPAPKPAEPVLIEPAPKAVEGSMMLGPLLPAPPTAGFGKPFVDLAPAPSTVPMPPTVMQPTISPVQATVSPAQATPTAGAKDEAPSQRYLSIWRSQT